MLQALKGRGLSDAAAHDLSSQLSAAPSGLGVPGVVASRDVAVTLSHATARSQRCRISCSLTQVIEAAELSQA